MKNKPSTNYWKANLRLLAVMLVSWFIVGIALPVLFVDELNGFRIAGFKVGFWFAFQGGFILFPILGYVYYRLMQRLDKKFGMEDE